MILHKNYPKILLIITVLSLGACACLYKPPSPAHYLTWQQRQRQLTVIKNWNIYATLGIKYANESSIAHFYWKQARDRFSINIYTLINLGGIKITGGKNRVSLWKSATEKITAATPEQLMYNELGWSLPLFNMKYWILGLPAPQIPYIAKFDYYNHLSFLQQQGWQIEYSNFQSIGDIDLPSKIWLSAPRIQIKIVIKQWQIL